MRAARPLDRRDRFQVTRAARRWLLLEPVARDDKKVLQPIGAHALEHAVEVVDLAALAGKMDQWLLSRRIEEARCGGHGLGIALGDDAVGNGECHEPLVAVHYLGDPAQLEQVVA